MKEPEGARRFLADMVLVEIRDLSHVFGVKESGVVNDVVLDEAVLKVVQAHKRGCAVKDVLTPIGKVNQQIMLTCSIQTFDWESEVWAEVAVPNEGISATSILCVI